MAKSYQDTVLNQVRKENMSVTVYLTNGFQIRGIVKGFDNYVIIVEAEGKHQMIYKHAVSTIAPQKSLSELFDAYEKVDDTNG